MSNESSSMSEAPQPSELLTGSLRDRLEQFDRGAFDQAAWRVQADEWSRSADARYRACTELRPLSASALPIAVGVKDTVDVVGFSTRLGLRRFRHYPVRSARVLERLRAGVVNAKVVTTELNIGLGSGCRNPLLPQIDPAGASTGSAVAVAAGICDLSLGTDVLGSVRWPAGRCGVVGLRTTHDAELLDGILPLSPSMDAVGWVTRTADDLAVLWDRLNLSGAAGPDGAAGLDGAAGPGGAAGLGGMDGPADQVPGSQVSGRQVPGGQVLARRCRIGVVTDIGDGTVEPAIEQAWLQTANALEAAGHELCAVSVGELWQWRGAAWELCARDAVDGFAALRDWIDDELSPTTLAALAAGERVDDRRLAEIEDGQRRLRTAVAGLFVEQRVDAWLLPLDPTVPRPRGAVSRRPGASTIPTPDDPDYDSEVGYTTLASFAGLPAISFPVGRYGVPEAPLAMQLIGPRHSERTLIRLADDAAGRLDLPKPRLR